VLTASSELPITATPDVCVCTPTLFAALMSRCFQLRRDQAVIHFVCSEKQGFKSPQREQPQPVLLVLLAFRMNCVWLSERSLFASIEFLTVTEIFGARDSG
jgi:hypothetical protein